MLRLVGFRDDAEFENGPFQNRENFRGRRRAKLQRINGGGGDVSNAAFHALTGVLKYNILCTGMI